MRHSILPNLVLAAKRNADRGVADAALFEVGPIYLDDTPEGQLLVAGGVRVGATPRHWGQASRPVDALDAKADALAVLTQLGLAADAPQVATERPPGTTPGARACSSSDPRPWSRSSARCTRRFSRRSTLTTRKLGPVVGFEVFLDRLPAPKTKRRGRCSSCRRSIRSSATSPSWSMPASPPTR
jgi:phenylalanyl-tRNA synthetase beta chain